MNEAIRVENLSKCYGNSIAVYNLGFTMEKGTVSEAGRTAHHLLI